MNIDVHSHVIPKGVVDCFKKNPKYGFSIRENPDGSENLVGLYFDFPLEPGFYDVKTRLKDMKKRSVDKEFASMVPTFYDLPMPDHAEFFRIANDAVAEMCSEAKDTLFPCGTLYMQDPAFSFNELERLVKEYNIRMVEVNTNVNGRYYDDPEFLPLFEKCQKYGVTIMFHPQHRNLSYGLNAYYLTNFLGNPVDTTVCATRLVLGGVLQKYPECKCIFVHGGGFVPYQRGRIEHGFRVREEAKVNLKNASPEAYFDKLYYDTITHGGKALAYLIASHGADHIMLGSDYPFDMADLRPAEEVLDLPGVSAKEKELILSKNIIQMTGINVK